MKENFSKGVQSILKYAKEEAVRLGHSYVGSEHLLLGIIKDANGKASTILASIGCGDQIFERLDKYSQIELDCEIGTIKPIH